ncbi:MAG: hypothetical protein V1897_13880 [Pseudomonadota bacterium]
MHVLAVGQPYSNEASEWPEGCHYNFDSYGHWLHYFYEKPTLTEIASIQRGPARFGLFVQDPVTFLLHQFGQIHWHDASYSFWLVSREHRRIPELTEGEHAFLRVVLVDTTKGIVAALRALTFSAEFTRRRHEEILRQSESPWNPSQRDTLIESVYSRFTTQDLVERSIIFCNGGD